MMILTRAIRFIFIGLSPFLVVMSAAAEPTFPKPQGFVNDFAQVMDSGTRSQLEEVLRAFDEKSGRAIAVVTIPSLAGQPVEDYAVQLFAAWKIGKAGKDSGILFLIAPNERKMRIEVGYGLEGTINDALAGRILDHTVVPRFKAGDLSDGIVAGTLNLITVIAEKEGIHFDIGQALTAALSPQTNAQPATFPLPWPLKIFLLVLLLYLFIRHPWLFFFLLMNSGRGGGFGGGGFSGGFGGFGGGGSGGGGSSRSW